MNDEIKEILNSIKYAVAEDDWFEIEGHFLKPLLDYTTDLQEENKKLQEDKDRVVSEREDLLSSCLYQDNIIKKAIEELELWQPKIEALKIERDYLLDILRGKDNV